MIDIKSNWKLNGYLAPAQGEVLLGLAEGMTDKEIARARGCSPKTVESNLYRLKERMFGKMTPYGTRTKIVAEAILRGWISPLMVLFVITSLLVAMVNPQFDIQVRRSRSSSRNVASRLVRGRKNKLPFIDIDISELDENAMLALFEAQASQPNRLAPWSTVAWTRTFNFTNQDRLEMWRSELNQLAV